MLWRGVGDVKCWWAAQVQWGYSRTYTHRNTERIRFYPVWVCFLHVFVNLFCHVFVCCACPSIQINSFFVTPASQIFFKSDAGVSWMGWWHCRGALPRLCAQSEWGVAEGAMMRSFPCQSPPICPCDEKPSCRDVLVQWSFQNQSSWIYVMYCNVLIYYISTL